MENNVDRYAEVMKDLLFIANARIEVAAATHRLKKNLTVHELSEHACCDHNNARYALNKVLTDDLIGELQINPLPETTVNRNFIKVKFRSLVANFKQNEDSGSCFIANLIKLVGTKTIMKDKL